MTFRDDFIPTGINTQLPSGIPLAIGNAEYSAATFAGQTINNHVFLENEYYSFRLPVARYRRTRVTYTLSGALPNGMTRNGRTISGTPDTRQTATQYTWTVTDDDGGSDSITFTIAVEEDTSPTYGANSLLIIDPWFSGQPVDVTIPVPTGGNGVLTETVQLIQAGLEYDPTTRRLTAPVGGVETTTTLFPSLHSFLEILATDEDGDNTSYGVFATEREDLYPRLRSDGLFIEKIWNTSILAKANSGTTATGYGDDYTDSTVNPATFDFGGSTFTLDTLEHIPARDELLLDFGTPDPIHSTTITIVNQSNDPAFRGYSSTNVYDGSTCDDTTFTLNGNDYTIRTINALQFNESIFFELTSLVPADDRTIAIGFDNMIFDADTHSSINGARTRFTMRPRSTHTASQRTHFFNSIFVTGRDITFTVYDLNSLADLPDITDYELSLTSSGTTIARQLSNAGKSSRGRRFQWLDAGDTFDTLVVADATLETLLFEIDDTTDFSFRNDAEQTWEFAEPESLGNEPATTDVVVIDTDGSEVELADSVLDGITYSESTKLLEAPDTLTVAGEYDLRFKVVDFDGDEDTGDFVFDIAGSRTPDLPNYLIQHGVKSESAYTIGTELGTSIGWGGFFNNSVPTVENAPRFDYGSRANIHLTNIYYNSTSDRLFLLMSAFGVANLNLNARSGYDLVLIVNGNEFDFADKVYAGAAMQWYSPSWSSGNGNPFTAAGDTLNVSIVERISSISHEVHDHITQTLVEPLDYGDSPTTLEVFYLDGANEIELSDSTLPWITFDEDTRVLDGEYLLEYAPAHDEPAAQHTLRYKITDGDGETDQLDFTLTLQPAPDLSEDTFTWGNNDRFTWGEDGDTFTWEDDN